MLALKAQQNGEQALFDCSLEEVRVQPGEHASLEAQAIAVKEQLQQLICSAKLIDQDVVACSHVCCRWLPPAACRRIPTFKKTSRNRGTRRLESSLTQVPHHICFLPFTHLCGALVACASMAPLCGPLVLAYFAFDQPPYTHICVQGWASIMPACCGQIEA
jgi:hypothetical protein